MTRTEISFIVPVYKTDPDTLNRCLKSIEASIEDETYQIIVIHDGLDIDDRITAIVQNFKEAELHRVRHGGVSAARNAGLNFAQADWVIFVDADDCLVPRSVTEMYSLISLNEEIDFLAANHFRKYEHKLVPIYNYNNKIDLFKKNMFLSNILRPSADGGTVWGSLFKASVLSEMEYYFDPTISNGEDIDFVLRYCALCANIATTNIMMYVYIISDQSVVHKFDDLFLEKMLYTIDVIKKDVIK